MSRFLIALMLTILVTSARPSKSIGGDIEYMMICVGNNISYNYVTNTIQTLGKYNNQFKGVNRILRGKFDSIYITNYFIGGYLNTKYNYIDGLAGLEGPDDREGYFLFDRKSEKVVSGISFEKFRKIISKVYGLNINKIIALQADEVRPFPHSDCGFKNKISYFK